MKTMFTKTMKAHPYVIFLAGFLTCALIVGLMLFYKFMSPYQYESAVLRGTLNSRPGVQFVAPNVAPTKVNNLFPTPTGSLQAFPTPTGSLQAFPTPTGS